MRKLQKILLILVFTAILAVILLTWGSVGSAVMTLALLLGLGFLGLQRFMENRDPDDFKWEE